MFNNYSTNNELNINACSGGIYKTCKESWFYRFHLNSNYADSVFQQNSNTKVLQMVICGNMEVIAEVIDIKDYEKLFKKEVSND